MSENPFLKKGVFKTMSRVRENSDPSDSESYSISGASYEDKKEQNYSDPEIRKFLHLKRKPGKGTKSDTDMENSQNRANFQKPQGR